MMVSKKKKKFLKIGSIPIILYLLYNMFLGGDYPFFDYLSNLEKKDSLEEANKQLGKLLEKEKKRNLLLKKRDPLEMERIAREQGFIREGEVIYRYKIKKEKE